jgi:CheY-like chemotaxis protein
LGEEWISIATPITPSTEADQASSASPDRMFNVATEKSSLPPPDAAVPATGIPCETRPVLVVEDDFLVRMMAADMIADAGVEVLEAGSADDALKALEVDPHVAVLFTDIDMPGSMDGMALAHRVAERWPHIRVVVTSGRHGPGNGALPAKGLFIGKPYLREQLLKALALGD